MLVACAAAATVALGSIFFPDEAGDAYGLAVRMLRDADRTYNDGAARHWTVSRTAAAEIAWTSAPSWHEGVTLAASALWTGNAVAFERPPIMVLEPDPTSLEEKIVDAVISAALTSGAAAGAHIACGTVGDVLAPGLGQVAGPICGMLAIGETDAFRRTVHQRITGRPADPDAVLVGAIVGSIAGNYAAMYLTQSARFGSYAAYEKAARSMTEKTYRAEREAIDPRGLRGATYHLDHRVPVRCGYMLAIPPELIAAAVNLRILTAQANMAIGARGCAG